MCFGVIAKAEQIFDMNDLAVLLDRVGSAGMMAT